jgi:hypothetical protein
MNPNNNTNKIDLSTYYVDRDGLVYFRNPRLDV